MDSVTTNLMAISPAAYEAEWSKLAAERWAELDAEEARWKALVESPESRERNRRAVYRFYNGKPKYRFVAGEWEVWAANPKWTYGGRGQNVEDAWTDYQKQLTGHRNAVAWQRVLDRKYRIVRRWMFGLGFGALGFIAVGAFL